MANPRRRRRLRLQRTDLGSAHRYEPLREGEEDEDGLGEREVYIGQVRRTPRRSVREITTSRMPYDALRRFVAAYPLKMILRSRYELVDKRAA